MMSESRLSKKKSLFGNYSSGGIRVYRGRDTWELMAGAGRACDRKRGHIFNHKYDVERVNW